MLTTYPPTSVTVSDQKAPFGGELPGQKVQVSRRGSKL